MSAELRHLEWRNFRDLVDDGVPAFQSVSGSPALHVFVDEGGDRIGLRVCLNPGDPIPASPLAEVDLRTVSYLGDHMLEVSTRLRPLFVEFYGLMQDMADRVQLQGSDPVAAFAETIRNWKALLRPTERMPDEMQVGLVGELWLLRRLMTVGGSQAIDGWTGPAGEPHDFRLGTTEIEVKTTRRHRRLHRISSLEQLSPSSGRVLFVLSLMLQPAGRLGGWTLPELVDEVRTLVAAAPTSADRLEQALLLTWRYSDAHASHYAQRLEMRHQPVLIEVADGFPRITRPMIEEAVGHEAHRVLGVDYELDLDGLGVAEGSPEFASVLPEVPER
jgi:Putative  PD-(D/E)XK family member, (DUF4420)